MKRTLLSLLTITVLGLATSFAHENSACCAGMAKNDMHGKCEATFANLNLTAEQSGKMKTLAAECDKGGCNAQSMTKMEKGARKILTKEQFAQWKAACSTHASDRKQS
jgi:hypothetical protein